MPIWVLNARAASCDAPMMMMARCSHHYDCLVWFNIRWNKCLDTHRLGAPPSDRIQNQIQVDGKFIERVELEAVGDLSKAVAHNVC